MSLEAWSSAVGDAINEFAGFRATRLTAQASLGATSLAVESTHGMTSAGSISVDGCSYEYLGKTGTSLSGVRYVDVGPKVLGRLTGSQTLETGPTVGNTSWVEVRLLGIWGGSVSLDRWDGTSWSLVTTFTENGTFSARSLATTLKFRLRAALTRGEVACRIFQTHVDGVRQVHRPAAVVLDMTRAYSAQDLVRRGFFVPTAEGEDLSALGENLGVRRPPNLQSDSVYRGLLQATAYAPRGTHLALEVALAAYFGPANFRIVERFRGVVVSPSGVAVRAFHPSPTARNNTVFVQLLNGVSLSSDSVGQAYFAMRKIAPLATGPRTVPVDFPPSIVQGVRLADENIEDLFNADRPSELAVEPYPGAAPAAYWTFAGVNEITNITLTPYGSRFFGPTGVSLTYSRVHARVTPESEAIISLLVRLDSIPDTAANSPPQFFLRIEDRQFNIMVGMAGDVGGVLVGFVNASTRNFIGPTPVLIPAAAQDCFHEIAVRKLTDGTSDLLINGHVVLSTPNSIFPASSASAFTFGTSPNVGSRVDVVVQRGGYWSRNPADYWNLRGVAGTVNSGTPARFNTASGLILGGDLGRAFLTYSAAVPRNRGRWRVSSVVDTNSVDLVGVWKLRARVESANPDDIFIGASEFIYPDCVGQRIELGAGSVAPNTGVYVIAAAVDPATGLDITGTAQVTTNRVRVVTPPPGGFVTDGDITWRLLPNFQTETGLRWELVAAGTVSPTQVTLRQNPPNAATVPVMEVTYATIPSAQLLPDAAETNDGDDWYPLYLPGDPLGPFRNILEDLTVAGVIAETEPLL